MVLWFMENFVQADHWPSGQFDRDLTFTTDMHQEQKDVFQKTFLVIFVFQHMALWPIENIPSHVGL